MRYMEEPDENRPRAPSQVCNIKILSNISIGWFMRALGTPPYQKVMLWLVFVCLSFALSVHKGGLREWPLQTCSNLFTLGIPPVGLSLLPSALSPPQTVQTCSLYSHTSQQAVALLLKDFLVLILIIIFRKRSLGQDKVFYSHLSLCPQGSLCLGGPCPGESLSRGVSVQRGLCQGEPPCG